MSFEDVSDILILISLDGDDNAAVSLQVGGNYACAELKKKFDFYPDVEHYFKSIDRQPSIDDFFIRFTHHSCRGLFSLPMAAQYEL